MTEESRHIQLTNQINFVPAFPRLEDLNAEAKKKRENTKFCIRGGKYVFDASKKKRENTAELKGLKNVPSFAQPRSL